MAGTSRRRVALGSLLDNPPAQAGEESPSSTAEPAAPAAAAPAQTRPAPAPDAPEVKPAPASPAAAPEPSVPGAQTRRLHTEFERKDTRLVPGQNDQLTLIARRLNKAHKGGERITENTLIRIGVAWLLSNADRLEGATEDELRASVGIEPLP